MPSNCKNLLRYSVGDSFLVTFDSAEGTLTETNILRTNEPILNDGEERRHFFLSESNRTGKLITNGVTCGTNHSISEEQKPSHAPWAW